MDCPNCQAEATPHCIDGVDYCECKACGWFVFKNDEATPCEKPAQDPDQKKDQEPQTQTADPPQEPELKPEPEPGVVEQDKRSVMVDNDERNQTEPVPAQDSDRLNIEITFDDE